MSFVIVDKASVDTINVLSWRFVENEEMDDRDTEKKEERMKRIRA